MGRKTNLRDLIGIIKDKASQSKAAIVFPPKSHSLYLSLLRATTHDPFTPPNPKHITTLLSYGHGSRATASAAIEALMDRLQSTHDSSVAIKCLIIVHSIIKHGSFILLDQLSVYPSTGGRNYLNLSNFRDNSTPLAWELSSWVRWYARYLEHVISTSRVLGLVLCSTSSTTEKDRDDKILTLTNSDLLKEIDSLVGLMEEASKTPESLLGNSLVEPIMGMAGEDYLSSINHISVRVDEFNHRLGCLSFGDSVELVCVLKRLEGCKEGMEALSYGKKAVIDSLWLLSSELKEKVGMDKFCKGEEGRLLLTWGSKGRESKSTRFDDRFVRYSDSVKFSSARFGSNEFGFSEMGDNCAWGETL